jgi:hypothetical protein
MEEMKKQLGVTGRKANTIIQELKVQGVLPCVSSASFPRHLLGEVSLGAMPGLHQQSPLIH